MISRSISFYFLVLFFYMFYNSLVEAIIFLYGHIKISTFRFHLCTVPAEIFKIRAISYEIRLASICYMIL